jgi:magnesium-transporting ATPase (P-type)
MSCVLQGADKIHRIYIKGADNIIKERLKKPEESHPHLAYIDGKLSDFSLIGLRTLMMAVRVLSDVEVKKFQDALKVAEQSPDSEAELEKLAEEWEQGFTLIGATAVEDKLQDGVPETIADLIRASNYY